MSNDISKSVLERLPLYLNYLQDIQGSTKYISSTAIAKELGLGEVLVRKDLALICKAGKPKIGYEIDILINDLSEYLDCLNATPAVVVGAGKLGCALLGYSGFTRFGIEIKAAFDREPNKYFSETSSKPILHLEELKDYCEKNNVQIGIITVPAEHAQEICDLLVSCGIKAIWNFARRKLIVPQDVIVRREDLAASVAILSCKLKNIQN